MLYKVCDAIFLVVLSRHEIMAQVHFGCGLYSLLIVQFIRSIFS
jgi:hypothetical protein